MLSSQMHIHAHLHHARPSCHSLQQMHTHLHYAHPSYHSPQQMVLRIKFLEGLGLKELGPPLPHLSLHAPHIDASVHLHKNFVQSSRTQCFLYYQDLAHYFLCLEHTLVNCCSPSELRNACSRLD